MGLLPRRRRFRRQEVLPNNDDESEQDPEEGDDNGDEDGDEDESEPLVTTSIPSSISFMSTSTENQLDKAKAIGIEVVKKVPSMYQRWWSGMGRKQKSCA